MAIVKALKITLGVILIIIGIISGPIPIVQGWIFIVFGLLLIGVKKETIKKWVGKAKKWIKKWIVKVIFLIFIIALAYSIAVYSEANSEVSELFGDKEEADVIVILNNDYAAIKNYAASSYQSKDEFEAKKEMIKHQQEGVFKGIKLKKQDSGKKASLHSAQADDYDFELRNAYTTVNGFAGKLKKSSYNKLKNSPNVMKIIKNGVKDFALDASVPMVNATNVWRMIYNDFNVTGRGETICVIDSGIDYAHPSLGGCTTDNFLAGNCSKVVAGHDFKNNDNNPIDDQGHGTHVAGIIASTNETYKGIAPDSNLVALKVCDSTASGNCTDSDIVSAIDWCVNNASTYNISVISMSLGGGLFTSYCDDESSESAFKIAIDNAVSRNISVVVATGNSGSTTAISSPACIKNSTAVGSVTKTDSMSSFSNRNSITDLFAPGSSIKSTVPSSGCVNCDSSGFLTLSGTSMATPHVAGAFALLHQYRKLEHNSILTPAQIQNALNSTGKQIDDTSGSGLFFSRINIYAALLSLDRTPPIINFTIATLVNNSNFTVNSTSDFVFINISSNEILTNSLLEWNGTNETMQGYGISWFKNKTNLNSLTGSMLFKVWGNDSSGNIGLSEIRYVQFFDRVTPNITLAGPTPQNNTKTSSSSLYINVTSDEPLAAALLEFNGTNESMNGSSLIWFKNKTAPSNQNATYTYKIWGNDSSGNVGLSEFRIFISNNTPPNISFFAPSELNLNMTEENSSFTFNVSFSDFENDGLTITWHKNASITAVNSNFTFRNNFSASGFYNITADIFDGNFTVSLSWLLDINNTNIAPNVTSVNLTNTDFLNRTNGTLMGFWAFTDLDDENNNITANETFWYINGTKIENYTNKTFIHAVNTTKLENWTFSARVFDGLNWSDFANSSAIRILNARPSINITTLFITALETQLVNITLNASDLDDEQLAFASNKSELVLAGNYMLWATNLTSSGNYAVNITVNDSADIDSTIVNITIVDARDLDNDNNPDFNDTDDDNDGINDNLDYLTGNITSIKSNIPLNITINGNISNLSGIFNGTYDFSITNGSEPLVDFNWTFNETSILDFGSINITPISNGSGAIIISGIDLSSLNFKKTAYVDKINTTVKSVCIKDMENMTLSNFTSACNGASESLVGCDNVTRTPYSCFDLGNRYKITGLNHSGVREQCIDNDGDGYGAGCAAGTDCNDNDRSKTTDCSSQSSSSSSSSSSGGGGGGGGGGSPGYVCNMDWKCSEWASCIDGAQTRQCNFVKVPQHVQETQCPQAAKVPDITQKCEMPKQSNLTKIQALEPEFLSVNEEKNISEQAAQQKEDKGQIKQSTGFAIRNIIGQKLTMPIIFSASFAALALVVFIALRMRKRK